MGIGGWGTHVVPIPYAKNQYTARQLAEGFSIDVGVIYYLAKKGKIPSKKWTPKRLRFPKRVVTALLRLGYNLRIT